MSSPRNSLALAAAVSALVLAGTAVSYPEGAPWGAADHRTGEDCASCHWERDPVEASRAITLSGLSPQLQAGAMHRLRLTLQTDDMLASGFQILAVNERGLAGSFETGDDTLEVKQDRSALRSTSVQRPSDAIVTWAFQWAAPNVPGQTVQFFIAVSAANDDQSPFGDQIHYQTLSVDIIDD